MPLLRRSSPTNNSSSSANVMYQDNNNPNNQQWQTMRGSNPDGSSTVYRVHESMMGGGIAGAYGGGGAGGKMYSASPYSHGDHNPNAMNYQQRNNNEPGTDAGSNTNGGGQQHPNSSTDTSPATVTEDEIVPLAFYEDDDEEEIEGHERCSHTTPLCFFVSILFAISFIVGYCFMIEAVVSNRRSHVAHSNEGAMNGALRRAGIETQHGNMQQHQQQSEGKTQYYILQPVNVQPMIGQHEASFSAVGNEDHPTNMLQTTTKKPQTKEGVISSGSEPEQKPRIVQQQKVQSPIENNAALSSAVLPTSITESSVGQLVDGPLRRKF